MVSDKQHFVASSARFVTIRELNWRGHCPYPDADTGATSYLQLPGQNLDKKFRADRADTGISSTRWRLVALDISSSRKPRPPSHTKEVNLASTRAFPRLTSYSGYHVATARCGSLPMELHSLMNYQNVTQNLFCATHFFAAFSGPTSPFSSKPRRDYLPDPHHRAVTRASVRTLEAQRI